MDSTRRDFLLTSAAVVTGAVLGRTDAFGARCGDLARYLRVQEPAFTPLRRNVGTFTMRGGTVGWLVNPDAVAVVDSQFPNEARALLRGLQERAPDRAVDVLLNTHHHGDHTGGNSAFRGAARAVVAHAQAAEHMRRPPGGDAPTDQLFPDTTFTDQWEAVVGDERVVARHHGRAHTSGDAVITFQHANVAHMGDLMFNRRHPVVDRAAGATIRGWIDVLEHIAGEHTADTLYIFGHANPEFPVVGSRADVNHFRDYLTALMTFVERHVQAGRSRDEILAMREPLAGFEEFGRFGNPGPRDALTCAYDEVADA